MTLICVCPPLHRTVMKPTRELKLGLGASVYVSVPPPPPAGFASVIQTASDVASHAHVPEVLVSMRLAVTPV